ncbi:hypothetical protein [Rubrivirga sp.]
MNALKPVLLCLTAVAAFTVAGLVGRLADVSESAGSPVVQVEIARR